MTLLDNDRVAVGAAGLDEYLDGDDCDPIEAPESLEQVDRLLGRLARIDADRAKDEAYAKARAVAIGEWLDARLHVYDGEAERIKALISAHHEHVLAQGGPKTLNLPNGTCKSREQKARIAVAEGMDAEVLGWAQHHRPELVREKVTHSIDRSALGKVLAIRDTPYGPVVVDPDDASDPVPGLVVAPAGRTFAVSANALPETTEDAA